MVILMKCKLCIFEMHLTSHSSLRYVMVSIPYVRLFAETFSPRFTLGGDVVVVRGNSRNGTVNLRRDPIGQLKMSIFEIAIPTMRYDRGVDYVSTENRKKSSIGKLC